MDAFLPGVSLGWDPPHGPVSLQTHACAISGFDGHAAVSVCVRARVRGRVLTSPHTSRGGHGVVWCLFGF